MTIVHDSMFFGVERWVLRLLRIDLLARARAEIEKRDVQLGKDVGARFSRGNLAIQGRRFQMPYELERERKRVATIKFAK